MLTPTLGKSVLAMAAIRSCGDAFVAVAPRRTASRSTSRVLSSPLKTDLGPIAPRNMTDPPLFRRREASRDISTPALRSATKPLVVCGPSGVGKGTIIGKFMEQRTEGSPLPEFCFSVSHTTRQPRPGEVDGVHYHFVTREFMQDKIDSGNFFLEHAEVHGNMYGTSFQAIFDVSSGGPNEENKGGRKKQCLLDIDVEGARSIKEFQSRQRREKRQNPTLDNDSPPPLEHYLANVETSNSIPDLDAKFIFIAPPSVDVLRSRLAGRGTETEETLERRFRNARAELDYGLEPGNFDAVVVNDDLDEACREFERVVEEMYAGV